MTALDKLVPDRRTDRQTLAFLGLLSEPKRSRELRDLEMSMSSNHHNKWPLDHKIYIGDIGNDARRYELEDTFSPFGSVKNVWIAKRPPCFAFILMDDPRDAVKKIDGIRMCGGRVKVEHGNKGGEKRGRGDGADTGAETGR